MLFKGLWLLFHSVHVFKDEDWAFIWGIFKYKETQGKRKQFCPSSTLSSD